MIVASDTDVKKWAMFLFLEKHGVGLKRSEDFQAIGRLSPHKKDLIGVVGYNGFCGKICAMHIAGEGNWISREFIKAAFDYPFNQLGMKAIIAPVAADNAKALRLDQHFGFKEIHRVPDAWADGVDLVFLQLNREDCRYLQAGFPLLREAA